MSKDVLSDHFLIEWLSACLSDVKFYESCKPHMDYTYMPDEVFKKVWKAVVTHKELNGKLPTIGILYEKLGSNEQCESLLEKINDKKIKRDDHDQLLGQLETFVRMSMFRTMMPLAADMFNGGKYEDSYGKINALANKLANFSIREGYYESVFGDYDKRELERVLEQSMNHNDHERLPFSVDEMDENTNGGLRMAYGDLGLGIARSGTGKSFALRHIGVGAARRGLNGIHFQLEGTKKECLEGFDANWIGESMQVIQICGISEDKQEKILKTLRSITGEIKVHAFEQFNAATIDELKNVYHQIKKTMKRVDFIAIDYLEKLMTNNGIRYTPEQERHRRLALGDDLKNFTVAEKIAGVTMTQANDIPFKMWNSPDFYMTRSNVSECKGIVNPFSYVFTMNQTQDEYENDEMRIFDDKIRGMKAGKLYRIKTGYGFGRFYDQKATIKMRSEQA